MRDVVENEILTFFSVPFVLLFCLKLMPRFLLPKNKRNDHIINFNVKCKKLLLVPHSALPGREKANKNKNNNK